METPLSSDPLFYKAYQSFHWLTQSGQAGSLEPLFADLTDPNPTTRLKAVQALEAYGQKVVVLKLLSLLSDPSWSVREAVVSSLVQRSDPEIFPALRQFVAKNWSLRVVLPCQHRTIQLAVIILGEQQNRQAEKLLIRILKQGYRDATFEQKIEVRQAAAYSLGRIGTPAAVTALLATLKQQENFQLREAVADILSELRDEAVLRPLLKALKPRFLEDVTDLWLRQEVVVTALGKIGAADALSYLLHLGDSPCDSVRKAQRIALARLGYPQAD